MTKIKGKRKYSSESSEGETTGSSGISADVSPASSVTSSSGISSTGGSLNPKSHHHTHQTHSGENYKKRCDSKRQDFVDNSDSSEDESEEGPEDEEFLVETICDMRVDKSKRYFFVKWAGYSEKHNSWEPEENMRGCNELIKMFVARRKMVLQKHVPENGVLKDPIVQKKSKPQIKYPNHKRMIEVKNITISNHTPDIQKKIAKSVERVFSKDQLSGFKKLASSSILQQKFVSKDRVILHASQLKAIQPKIKTPKYPPDLVYNFKLWANNQVQLLHLNLNDEKQLEEYYNIIVTEDISGLSIDYVFGTTMAEDGHCYCLVQFEGSPYIDVVPPLRLYKQFPGVESLFSKHVQVQPVTC